MTITGFDGYEHTIKFKKSRKGKVSSLHTKAIILLEKKFPYDTIYEEILLPGSSKRAGDKPQYADIFIPSKKMIVEVHGKQHYEFCMHFHQNKLGFMKAQRRDRDKKEWCQINDIKYVELPYNKIDQWGDLI